MRARLLGLLALHLAAWSGPPAAAQTRFVPRDTAVNLAAYAVVEECQAAVFREADFAATREAMATGIWRDTMPLAPGEEVGPPPATAMITARGCLTRFAKADSVSLNDFLFLFPLYLTAGWEAKARTLVERRLAAIGPKAEGELGAVLDTVVKVALGHGSVTWALTGFKPHFALADALVTPHLPRVSDRVTRLLVYVDLMQAAAWEQVKDTVALQRLGAQALPIFDSLTERDRAKLAEKLGPSADEGDLAERFSAFLDMVLGKPAFLAALRRSTAEYVRLRRDTWTRATGQPPETYMGGVPLGERAPALLAELWLGPRDTTTPRPTPGRVSLVVFLTNPECVGVVQTVSEMYGECAGTLIALRRLAQRFPALEITVVAQTHGYFTYLKDSLTLEREAELTQRWLKAYGVEAPLVMAANDVLWLPEPDGRRVVRGEVPNYTNYSFGKSYRALGNRTAFLVDQDGFVVHADKLQRYSEPEFAEMIEILLERGPAQRESATGASANREPVKP